METHLRPQEQAGWDPGSWAEEGDPILGQNQRWCGDLMGLAVTWKERQKLSRQGGEDSGGAGKGEESQEGLLRSLSTRPSAQAFSDVF